VGVIYQLLSQEGDLVGDLVEEIVARSSERCPVTTGNGASPTGYTPRP
jgi:hypothetical protein